jgi:hypothetical protein
MSEVGETRSNVAPPPALVESRERRSIKPDPLQFEALTTFARLDFWCFVELMFPVLYPGQELVYAGYLELIATLLMRVGQHRYRNVVINLPPRHMKSALASILYPAWRLGCDPTVKFICISYGDDLAHDLSAQTRKIMRSPLYKLIFPGTVLDKSAVDHIRTTLGGYRYATAVGSDITGFGADEIIIDDPVQPEDALSERVKQQLRDWVNSSVYTRFNDPSKGALVLVMHRLAPDDLAGTIEPSADYVLKLPLIAEKTDDYTFRGKTIMRREPGEPLNPSRLNAADIEALKARIAPHVFASQYQQRPEAGGTGYCSIERLARFAEAPPFELIVHSSDIASTKGGGDWTVCAKFGLAKESDGREILYLTGIVRMQVELPDVREAIIAHDSHDKPAIIVMDGNGNSTFARKPSTSAASPPSGLQSAVSRRLRDVRGRSRQQAVRRRALGNLAPTEYRLQIKHSPPTSCCSTQTEGVVQPATRGGGVAKDRSDHSHEVGSWALPQAPRN